MIRLRLEPNSGVPLGLQIERQLRLAVAAGRLEAGARLPAARDLARNLRVNFHTVRKAYNALEKDGLLVSLRGRGTFVASEVRPLSAAELRRKVRQHIERLLEDIAGLEIGPERLTRLAEAELTKLMWRKRWVKTS